MFKDRIQAGQLLAQALKAWRGREEVVVLAIPRGGVVIGRVLADELRLPLDVVIVRKIGFPNNPELAMGAVDLNGTVTLNEEIGAERVDPVFLEKEIREQLAEAKRQEVLYRAGKKPLEPTGRRTILVDDGIATGQTMQAAINYLRQRGVKEIILATPVASPDITGRLKSLVDRMVVLKQPVFFAAVGQFYQNFPQVSDEEVTRLLQG